MDYRKVTGDIIVDLISDVSDLPFDPLFVSIVNNYLYDYGVSKSIRELVMSNFVQPGYQFTNWTNDMTLAMLNHQKGLVWQTCFVQYKVELYNRQRELIGDDELNEAMRI